MYFDDDEKAVFQEQNVSMDANKWSGPLILTNKRLIMERIEIEKSKIPIVGKKRTKESIFLVVPLTEISDVETVKKHMRIPSHIRVIHSGKSTQFTVEDPIMWANLILTNKSGVNNNNHKPSVQSEIRTHLIERQIVKVKCRYCGALYDEVKTKCPNCGAPR
jgi:RNA polymerase subunit RPABC4/transcription elongation factor Spt4